LLIARFSGSGRSLSDIGLKTNFTGSTAAETLSMVAFAPSLIT
jgi:hypothetical protein